jgi:hypothetical protein
VSQDAAVVCAANKDPDRAGKPPAYDRDSRSCLER